MKLVNLLERDGNALSADVAMPKIASYIGNQLGINLVRIPGFEGYSNSSSKGVGIRYVDSGSARCIRFNWNSLADTGKLTRIKSIDFFNGKSRDPSYTIKTDGISILQALPVIIDLMQHPELGKFTAFPVDPKLALAAAPVSEAKKPVDYNPSKVYPDSKDGVKSYLMSGEVNKRYQKLLASPKARFKPDPSVDGVWAVDLEDGTRIIVYLAGYREPSGNKRERNDWEEGETPSSEKLGESFLTEVRADAFSAEEALDDFLHKLANGKSFTRSEFAGSYHINNVGIFDTVASEFKDRFVLSGKRLALAPGKSKAKGLDRLKDSILSKAGIVEIVKGGTKETYSKTKEEERIEDDPNRPSFTDTLEHLDHFVSTLASSKSKGMNAIFTAGRGGVGKTQTVMTALHRAGLADGSGFFKNTGSASAAGIYVLLYHHRNDIVVFDDSDGALGDVDARNLIKAATDTGDRRKMVWNKKSSFIYDADDDAAAEQYKDDLSMAPNHYDFNGKIIFISNLPIEKLDPDGAIKTRAILINFDPSDNEVLDYIEKNIMSFRVDEPYSLSKDERLKVLDAVRRSKRKGDVNFRTFVRALAFAAPGTKNWEKLVELYA